MQYTFLDFISLFIFFSGTVLIISVRKVFLVDEENTFHTLVSGFSILSIVSLLNLLAFNNLLETIPFFNKPVFLNIAYWIGVITGLTLVLHGVSRWLPVYREYKKISNTKINELEIFRKAEQIIQIDKKIPTIFDSVLKLFVDTYPVYCGGAYIKDSKSESMVISSFYCTKDEHVFDVNEVSKLIAEFTIDRENRYAIVNRKVSGTTVSLFPVFQSKEVIGFFILNTGNDLKREAVDSIKLLVDILESKVTFISSLEESKENRDQIQWIEKTLHELDTNKSINENLPAIYTLVSERVELDHISICIPENGSLRKVMLGSSGQLLEYTYDSFAENLSIENYALSYMQSVIINDLSKETDFFIDPLLLKMNCRSMMAIPVGTGESNCLIVLSSFKKSIFDNDIIDILKPLRVQLDKMLSNAVLAELSQKETDLYEQLQTYSMNSLSLRGTRYLDSQFINLISSNIESLFIRVSMIEDDVRFLHSMLLHTAFPHKTMTPEDGVMFMELMPGHLEAYNRQKSVTVFSDTESSQDEQVQVFGRSFKHMTIVPITGENRVQGFVTIGFEDSLQAIDDVSTRFIQVASAIYGRLRNIYLEHEKLQSQNRDYKLQVNEMDSVRRMNRLKSSVTSMLGSMELLQSTDKNDDRFQRYLSLANRSVKSMTELVTDKE